MRDSRAAQMNICSAHIGGGKAVKTGSAIAAMTLIRGGADGQLVAVAADPASAAAAAAALAADSAAVLCASGSGGPGFCIARSAADVDGAVTVPAAEVTARCSDCEEGASAVRVTAPGASPLVETTTDITAATNAIKNRSIGKRQRLRLAPAIDMTVILECRQQIDEHHYDRAAILCHARDLRGTGRSMSKVVH
jgi:hypothetical protein